MRRWIILLLLLLTALGALGYRWLQKPLVVAGTEAADLSIEPGTSVRQVAQAVADAGVQVDPRLLFWWFRVSGQDRRIKAGSYEIEAGTTPWGLLEKLTRGDEALRSLTLVEGWTFLQVREALAQAEALKHDSAALSDEALMTALAEPGLHPEGQFFPDTYTYAKGSSDMALRKRAWRAMQQRLQGAWALRGADSPLRNPEQALILASIVEKETGRPGDRPMVAAVFLNRLRIGMPLQTDPTVIYGLGARYSGSLRKRDLQADTPYNTYTRGGLPPTPIAMPGKASLLAVLQPASSNALYFVARGDGSSQFSATLQEHNRAVNKFIRGH